MMYFFRVTLCPYQRHTLIFLVWLLAAVVDRYPRTVTAYRHCHASRHLSIYLVITVLLLCFFFVHFSARFPGPS